jgi:hypothetical protein
MKKIFLSLAAIALMVACKKMFVEKPTDLLEEMDAAKTMKTFVTSSDSCTSDLNAGLLAYYPFNGNFNDESGNGHHATANNGAFLTTDYAGVASSCAGFDGSNDYLLVPASSTLNSNAVTISAQVMVNSNNRRHALISRTNFATASGTTMGLGIGSASSNTWSYSVDPETENCATVYNGSGSASVYDQNTVVPGQWYTIVAVFAGGVQKIYVNGVLQQTITRSFTNAKQCASTDLVIGGWWGGDIASIDGKIDEVRLYNRELSDCEISKLSCFADLNTGLLAYYPFNGNFNDESGNGNHATANNGAFLTTDFAGAANSCAGFDGSNDYLLVPANSTLNSNAVTISAQVMVNSANRRHALVSRTNFATASGTTMGLGIGSPTSNKWSYSVDPDTEDCSTVFNGSGSLSVFDQNTLVPGQWYNIVAVFAGGVQKLYVNGVLQGTLTRSFTNAKQCTTTDLVIGGWWQGDIASIDGKIDEVRLYNRELSDCEISKLAGAVQ